jgi:hypothetical protein
LNAIDIDDKIIVAVNISSSRTAFDAIYFLIMLLETFDKKPLKMIDRGT